MGACHRVRQLATKSSLNWKFRLTKLRVGDPFAEGRRGCRRNRERQEEEQEGAVGLVQHAGSCVHCAKKALAN